MFAQELFTNQLFWRKNHRCLDFSACDMVATRTISPSEMNLGEYGGAHVPQKFRKALEVTLLLLYSILYYICGPQILEYTL